MCLIQVTEAGCCLLQQKQRKELETLYSHLWDGLLPTPSFWDPRLHAGPLLGQQGLVFCGWLQFLCSGLSSSASLQPSCSCDRFCDEDPFHFGDDALWAQALSECENSSAQELPQQRVSKGKGDGLNGTPIFHLQFYHWFLAGYHTDFVKTPKISRNVYFWVTAQKELLSPLFLQRNNTTSIHSGRCTLQGPQMYHNRVGNGWAPNLKDTNTSFGNPICSVIPKLLRSIKSKPTISRIYCKSYHKTIKSPSARTQSSAVQLCSSKLHLPLQLNFLDLFIPFQFHHPSCDAALLVFPEFAVPAEHSKGQEKDQNQWQV